MTKNPTSKIIFNAVVGADILITTPQTGRAQMIAYALSNADPLAEHESLAHPRTMFEGLLRRTRDSFNALDTRRLNISIIEKIEFLKRQKSGEMPIQLALSNNSAGDVVIIVYSSEINASPHSHMALGQIVSAKQHFMHAVHAWMQSITDFNRYGTVAYHGASDHQP